MKLHKLAGSNDDHYIWWSIVSMVLQAKASAEGTSELLLLPQEHAIDCQHAI